MNFAGFIQSLLGGIGTGTVYALLGLSCSLILGRLQICSVMHGDLALLAGYLCYQAYTVLHISPFITVIVLLPVFFGIGYIVQSVFMKPFMKLETWKGRYQGQVMVSWGLGMSIMALEYIIFSGSYKTLNVPYRNATVHIGSVTIPVVHIISFALAIGLLIVVEAVLKKTSLGIKIRACSDDAVSARLTGIPYDKICAITFGISSALVAVAGLAYTLMSQLNPSEGFDLTFLGWAAVILGTMGNLKGAVTAGILMGIVQALTIYLWIPNLAIAAIYIVLIIILVIKPRGLFYWKKRERGNAA